MRVVITCSLLILVITNSSCKKDISSSNYLRGKVDGVGFECATSDISATTGSAGESTIFISGGWPSYTLRLLMDGQGTDITEGTYTFQTGKKLNAVIWQNNTPYSTGYFCGFFTPCTFSGSGRITILEINKKKIRGTFEFTTGIYAGTGLFKTVTDGDFFIRRN